jgi:hypothetical protein
MNGELGLASENAALVSFSLTPELESYYNE